MTSPRSATTSELLRRAFRATAATWPTLLLIICTTSLITYAASGLTALIPKPFGSIVSLIVNLLLNILSLGLVNGTLSYLRGGGITYGHLGSMIPFTMEVIGYSLCEGLLIFLWMLPGLGLTFIGSLLVSVPQDAGVDVLGGVILSISVLLMFVLVIRAALNYLLSSCYIVDDPCMGGFKALERSKETMKGNRWRYIKMTFPVLLMELAIFVLTFVLVDKVSETTLSLILDVLFIVPALLGAYMTPVFYEDLHGAEQ